MSLEDTFGGRTPPDRLSRLRADDRQGRLVVAGGVLIGLGLALIVALGQLFNVDVGDVT